MTVEKKIDVVGQMILGVTPSIVTQLYAFYRIKKFKKGVLVILMTLGLIALGTTIDSGIHLAMNKNIMPSNDSNFKILEYVIGIIITCLLPMYFARKWTLEYNDKIDSAQTFTS